MVNRSELHIEEFAEVLAVDQYRVAVDFGNPDRPNIIRVMFDILCARSQPSDEWAISYGCSSPEDFQLF
jgi:hypothetical protein